MISHRAFREETLEFESQSHEPAHARNSREFLSERATHAGPVRNRQGVGELTAVHQSDPDLTCTRIVGDALDGMLEEDPVRIPAQNEFQLLDQRRFEIDTRDRLLFTFWICFLTSADIVHITTSLPRPVSVPHPFSTSRTV